jgi:hypothetical protein
MNPFPTQILLATDGSENTTQATRAAVDIAGGGARGFIWSTSGTTCAHPTHMPS